MRKSEKIARALETKQHIPDLNGGGDNYDGFGCVDWCPLCVEYNKFPNQLIRFIAGALLLITLCSAIHWICEPANNHLDGGESQYDILN